MSTFVDNVDAFPLAWPQGWPRTRTPQRSRFVVPSLAVARTELFAEIKLLGGTLAILSTNIPVRRDGLPYSGYRQPEDPGVAVYFLRKGRAQVFACDRWNRVEDNIRAVARTIEALRGVERWGASEMMERAFTAFEALPAPEQRRAWWDILGLPEKPKPTAGAIRAAYIRKAQESHPDRGGTTEAMQELNRALDEARKAVGMA
jgi:hypothetical protein